MTLSLAVWIGRRVAFEHNGRRRTGTVRSTSETRLQILLDGCGHTGCTDHPPIWVGRSTEDVERLVD